MRSTLAVWAAVVVAGLLVAAEPDLGPKQGIEGTWRGVSATERGRAVAADMVKGARFAVTKDKLTMNFPGKDAPFTYKLLPTTKPKGIDLTRDGKTTAGIYKLEGDKLTLCLPRPGTATRPESFESPEGSDLTVFVMERVKK